MICRTSRGFAHRPACLDLEEMDDRGNLAAAAEVATALEYDIAAALEEPDGR